MKMATSKLGSDLPTQRKPYGSVILSLKNCLLDREKVNNTPSSVDGLDEETEKDLRIWGCELIQTSGILLKLPQVAMATAQVLFQRFYYSKSFVRYPMEVTAMACVQLASKIEESPRRIRDVMNVFQHIKQVKNQKKIEPLILDQNYINMKNQVIKAERRVLKELGFSVHVQHPNKIIVMYMQVLEKEEDKKFVQMAWNFMNDSFRTSVFVLYQPETIACACIYLSARKMNIPLPQKPPWYEIFGADLKSITDISVQLIKLYQRPKPIPRHIDKIVEDLRKKYQDSRQKSKTVSANSTPVARGFSPGSRQPSPVRIVNDAKSKDKNDGSPVRNNHVSRSMSKSPSRSASKSPESKRPKKVHRKAYSRSRSRSRSYERKPKKKAYRRRHSHSASPGSSPSPSRPTKKPHKEKVYRDSRSRSVSRDRRGRSRSSSYDKHRKNSSKSSRKIEKSEKEYKNGKTDHELVKQHKYDRNNKSMEKYYKSKKKKSSTRDEYHSSKSRDKHR